MKSKSSEHKIMKISRPVSFTTFNLLTDPECLRWKAFWRESLSLIAFHPGKSWLFQFLTNLDTFTACNISRGEKGKRPMQLISPNIHRECAGQQADLTNTRLRARNFQPQHSAPREQAVMETPLQMDLRWAIETCFKEVVAGRTFEGWRSYSWVRPLTPLLHPRSWRPGPSLTQKSTRHKETKNTQSPLCFFKVEGWNSCVEDIWPAAG